MGKLKKAEKGNRKTAPLLFEIGCEEIPARMLEQAQEQLGELIRSRLNDGGLILDAEAPVRTYSTPRRLVVSVDNVLINQQDKEELVQGPPVRVAYDAEGRPTKAADGFAKKCGVKVEKLTRVSRDGGEYVVARKVSLGRPAKEILPELLTGVIEGLNFPATMYWLEKAGPRFVRPVRWILAQMGAGRETKGIKLEFAGVKSSNATLGHRKAGKRPAVVAGFRDYEGKLKKLGVLISPTARRSYLESNVNVIVEKIKVKLRKNKEIFDWIVNSTEYPQVLAGSFDKRFLALPEEVLVSVMEGHQKYITLEDAKDRLQPRFLAVLDYAKDAKGLIQRGHERVLEARFRDAQFFWEADQRVRLEARLEQLKGMTFHSRLGSYHDKVERLRRLGMWMIASPALQGKVTEEVHTQFLRALELCKCDLTTEMVKEFPPLQGKMGGLYAAAQEEPAGVGEAIYDHYLPVSTDGPLPRSLLGAVVSLADKLDNIVSGFTVGLEPTGSSDPFALRRQGNAIIKLIIEKDIVITLKEITYFHVKNINAKHEEATEAAPDSVLKFFEERLRFLLERHYGFRYDTVNAVLATGEIEPVDVYRRAKSLEGLRDSEYILPLSLAAKRIANILAKSAKASDWRDGEINPALIEDGAEEDLFSALQGVERDVKKRIEAGKYKSALERTAALRPLVDRFFDKILVMAEEPEVRQNRLRLLAGLDRLFSAVARFSELTTTYN